MRKNRAHRAIKPDVFRYLDYRAYLKDWLAYQKAGQSGYSLRAFARAAKVAPGYLSMAITGARPLTPGIVARITPVLGLGPSGQSYFELLTTLGTSEDQEVRLRALARMKRFRAFRKLNPKETEVHHYLTRWYYVAIREMSMLPEFKPEASWIQPRLRSRVDLKDIKEALAFLSEQGFIELLPNGRAQPPEKRLDCDGGVFSLSMAGFHRQMLALAADSIEQTPREERNLIGHAFAADAATFAKAREILQEAFEKIRALEEDKKEADSVYFVELALFPFTRRTGDVSRKGSGK
ncbi:MAG: TIGR02147 family protein [Oligoflexia bacterium]|nr:TIGR02147 family protein [Oligoflexia bacterium]